MISDFLVTVWDTHLEHFFRLCSYENEGFDLNHLIKFDKLSNKQMTGLLCIQRNDPKKLKENQYFLLSFSTPLTDMDWWVKPKKVFCKSSDFSKEFPSFAILAEISVELYSLLLLHSKPLETLDPSTKWNFWPKRISRTDIACCI